MSKDVKDFLDLNRKTWAEAPLRFGEVVQAWTARCQGLAKAFDHWQKRGLVHKADDIVAHVKHYMTTKAVRDGYVMNVSTYIIQRIYEDPIETPAHVKVAANEDARATKVRADDAALVERIEKERLASIADFAAMSSDHMRQAKDKVMKDAPHFSRSKYAMTPSDTPWMRRLIVVAARDLGLVGEGVKP